MSKSAELKIAVGSFIGVAVLLIGAYHVADGNIADPRRGAGDSPSAAVTRGAGKSAAAEFVAGTGSGRSDSPAAGTSSMTGAAAGIGAAASAMIPAGYAGPVGFDLGREALAEEIAAWDIDIRPDGQGLPVGSGSVEQGVVLWDDKCATCHGDFGEAVDRWPVIAGGGDTLDGDDPVKTVGSYWPYLSTVYDYVHRAMPFGDAQSLTDDEVYALTAYILNLNDIVDEDFVLSNGNFAGVRLPNEDNFFMDDRDSAELARFSVVPCMEDCKETVRITKRAAVIDVTPDEPEGGSAAAAPEGGAGAGGEALASLEDAAVEAEVPADVAMAAFDPDLVEAGAKAFRRCKACHQLGEGAESKVGPHLNALMGRVIGGVEDFKYSKPFVALSGEGLVWERENLDEFLANPKKAIRGTRMSFPGLKKEGDRAAVIAYILAEGGG